MNTPRPATPPPPAHRFPVRVYFEDTDAGGVAYHATYLRWAERARTESLRAMHLPHGLMMERHNSMLVVRRIEVAYVRPARLDEALVVETRIREVGAASLGLDQAVTREADGALLARLDVGLVCVAVPEGGMATEAALRPARLPEPWRGRLKDLASGGSRPAG